MANKNVISCSRALISALDQLVVLRCTYAYANAPKFMTWANIELKVNIKFIIENIEYINNK